MTATPHSGNQANFEAFLALLDHDMFAGKPVQSQAMAVIEEIMRRLVKEGLLTFDGTPLFPFRKSQSVEYEFSTLERKFYESVTGYFRTDVNRAKRVADTRVQGNIGFALTISLSALTLGAVTRPIFTNGVIELESSFIS